MGFRFRKSIKILPGVRIAEQTYLFDTLEEVQDYATSSCAALLLRHHNHERPHQANKGKPPLMAA